LRLSPAKISRFFSPENCGKNPGDSMMIPISSGKSMSAQSVYRSRSRGLLSAS
jgi:hypothetical protein